MLACDCQLVTHRLSETCEQRIRAHNMQQDTDGPVCPADEPLAKQIHSFPHVHTHKQ